MKILFLTRSLETGGAERQLSVLANGLQRRGHDVTVAVFYGGGALESDLCSGTVRLINLQKGGRWSNFNFLLRLIRLILRERPNMIHGYLIVPNIITLLLRLFCPSARVVWGVRASDIDLSRYDWSSRLCYRLECVLSSRADLVIANSTSGKTFAVKNGFPATKTVVVPNGIDTERFRSDRKAGAALRRSWKLSDDASLIGLVGRIDPMKDHATFLKAAKQVHNERQDVRFVCVGRGEEADLSSLQRRCVDLGLGDVVIWAGEHIDMPAIYSSLDAACLCSAYGEGFPNVVAEAMSCGVPCVVTDVGDAAQIVGTTGFVVAPQDPRALGDALLSMLAQSRKLPDESLRQRIFEHFSVERLIETTEDALEKLHAAGQK